MTWRTRSIAWQRLMDRQGKYSEAEQLLQRAISIREKTLGPKHQRFAILLQNLASIYQAVQKYDDAAALHQRALNILEEALEPDHTRVAGSLHSLAALYEVQGRLQDALPLFQRSLAIREMRFGPVHPAVAVSLYSLSSVFRRTGNYALAESSLERALAIYREAMGPEDPRVATYLHGLALTHYAQGHAREASQLFQQGHELLRRQVDEQFAYMTEPERLAFLDTVADVFPAFLSFCLANRQGEPALAGQMYNFLLWKKGLIARSVASLRARIGDSKDSEALALLDNLIDARNALSNVRRAPSGDAVESRKWLESLEQQVHSYQRALVKRSSVLAREKVRLRATWRDVQRTLRHREAAVEIVRVQVHDGKELTGEVRYVALVLTANGSGPKVVELGTAESLEGPALAAYPQACGPGDFRTRPRQIDLNCLDAVGAARDGRGGRKPHSSLAGRTSASRLVGRPATQGWTASARGPRPAHRLEHGDLLRTLPSVPSSRAVLFGNPASTRAERLSLFPAPDRKCRASLTSFGKRAGKSSSSNESRLSRSA